MKAHLVLVSAQAVPNFTPILDERFKPEEVIMLVTDDMRIFSESLERIYQPRGVKVSRWPINDPWDIEHIRHRIEALLVTKKNTDISLNATGGTKPMSIAAYEVFRENNLDIFYVHPEQDTLIWMYPKRPSVDLADRIKLKEYLFAYGADKVKVQNKKGVDSSMRELSDELVSNIQRYESALSSLNYFAATADNPRLISAEIDKSFNGNYDFWDLVDLFRQAELLHRQGDRLRFPDKNARFLVNGGWLELYAYTCCLNLKKTSGIQDVSHSVEVSRKQGRNVVLNELDVALLKDNKLYVIECKTKRFSGNGKKHSKAADVLYKLDSITGILGGLYAKSMLVSYKKLQQHHRDRAKELEIELCCFQDLQFLQERIEKWTGSP